VWQSTCLQLAPSELVKVEIKVNVRVRVKIRAGFGVTFMVGV